MIPHASANRQRLRKAEAGYAVCRNRFNVSNRRKPVVAVDRFDRAERIEHRVSLVGQRVTGRRSATGPRADEGASAIALTAGATTGLARNEGKSVLCGDRPDPQTCAPPPHPR